MIRLDRGRPFPGTLNQDQQNEVLAPARPTGCSTTPSATTPTTAGRNDDHGQQRPDHRCPNANWNGVTTNYCAGVTADDIVAHEWGHAYTEYTPGLIYQWQSGALNEAYSDIWGETVDLINGRMNDVGEGNLTAARATGQCSDYTRGDIADDDHRSGRRRRPVPGAAPASFGPRLHAGRRHRRRRRGATDAADDARPDTTTDGCTAVHQRRRRRRQVGLRRPRHLHLHRQGRNAEAAGATGIVVGDTPPAALDLRSPARRTIYGLMVTNADGAKIKSAGTGQLARPGVATDAKTDSTAGSSARSPTGLRRRDPRHVEPELLRRPGQGVRRRVPLRRPTTAAACTATPAWSTTATRCSSTAAPTTARRSRHRPRQGRGHLLQRPDRLPDADVDFPDLADGLEARART